MIAITTRKTTIHGFHKLFFRLRRIQKNVILTLSKWLVDFNPKAKKMVADAFGFGIKRVETSKGVSDIIRNNTAAVDLAISPRRAFTEAMGSGVVWWTE